MQPVDERYNHMQESLTFCDCGENQNLWCSEPGIGKFPDFFLDYSYELKPDKSPALNGKNYNTVKNSWTYIANTENAVVSLALLIPLPTWPHFMADSLHQLHGQYIYCICK